MVLLALRRLKPARKIKNGSGFLGWRPDLNRDLPPATLCQPFKLNCPLLTAHCSLLTTALECRLLTRQILEEVRRQFMRDELWLQGQTVHSVKIRRLQQRFIIVIPREILRVDELIE